MTEKKVFILSIILLIFFISFTHLAGLLNANKDFYYTGLQPTRRGDMPGHLSFVIQAQDGNFLFKNLYNPTEQQALFFHPLWLTMGWTAKISGLNLAFIYHLFRVIFAIIFCFILKQRYDMRHYP